jgi:hypothetical protein
MGLKTKPLFHPAKLGVSRSDYYCCACNRDIAKDAKGTRMVHLIDGGDTVLHPSDETAYVSDSGDLGAQPIGSDCARKLGLEWSR